MSDELDRALWLALNKSTKLIGRGRKFDEGGNVADEGGNMAIHGAGGGLIN